MSTILKFTFMPIDACDERTEVYVDVYVHPSRIDYGAVEDAISSYIDSVQVLDFTKMICDVLSSFGWNFDFVEAEHEFVI